MQDKRTDTEKRLDALCDNFLELRNKVDAIESKIMLLESQVKGLPKFESDLQNIKDDIFLLKNRRF